MSFDYAEALQHIRQESKSTFEKEIFKVSIPVPFQTYKELIVPQEIKKIEVTKEEKVELEVKSLPVQNSLLKVLFVTDCYDEEWTADELKSSFEKKLNGYLKPEVVPLFSKMIQAMGLEEKEFELCAVNRQEQIQEIAASKKPTLIITIGAQATNQTLNVHERLATVHGKFFNHVFSFNGENFAAQVMPLFHPQLLQINPSMKRTAWADMQKAMKILGSV